MVRKVVITCAVTGSAPTPQKHAAVPVTPDAIADSAIGAARAGAAIVHIHVRDPATTLPSMELGLYQEVVERIRASDVDVLLNLTTGLGARLVLDPEAPSETAEGTTMSTAQRRIEHVLALKPEICSLDIATMNRVGFIYANLPAYLSIMARAVRDAGVKPELEVFDGGHLELAREMVVQGDLDTPALYQFCLGIKWGMPATPEALDYLLSRLPAGQPWSAFGIGAAQFPMLAQTVTRGGHVRVGFEDNLYLRRSVLAPSNAALVEQAVDVIRMLGDKVATAADARNILKLPLTPTPLPQGARG